MIGLIWLVDIMRRASGELAVLQAPMFDGLSFDPFSPVDDRFGPSEVGIGRRHVFQALVISLVVVVFDEGLDLRRQIAGQEVVFQEDAVLQGLVPTLDLALAWSEQKRELHVG